MIDTTNIDRWVERGGAGSAGGVIRRRRAFDVPASVSGGGSEARRAAAGERQRKQWPHCGREGSWRQWLAEKTVKEGRQRLCATDCSSWLRVERYVLNGCDPRNRGNW